MASTRKKQDEKNMKTLRELASLQHNKYCFDCNQRGPTYVNVTIGSFICTKCSGILRGLTPPHRVKSISMATFTTEEVDFFKLRGNAFCRRTWLGLYDGNIAETPDEQTVRDFMIDKYERKRYYLESPIEVYTPPPAISKANSPTPTVNSFSAQNRPNEIIPRHNKKVPDFVADFGTADIYNAVNSEHKDTNMNDNIKPFADFGGSVNNNVNATSWNFTNFNASFDQAPAVPKSNMNNVHNASTFPPAQEKATHAFSAPLEDRYAALKDLDSVFKTQPQFDWNLGSNGSTSPSSSLYSSPSDHGSTFGSSQLFPQPEVSKISNPFNTKIQWGDEVQYPCTANPFRTNDTGSKVVNGVTPNFYKSAPTPSNGSSSWMSNPFTLGPSNSSNPFL